MRHVAALLAIAVLPFLASLAAAQQPKPAASAQELMKSVVIPASDVVFGVGKAAPKTDKEWTAVQDGAARLSDAAKQLERLAPPANGANWIKQSRAMADAAETAGKAAKTKNADAVLDAGDVLYSTCENCHKQFMKNR